MVKTAFLSKAHKLPIERKKLIAHVNHEPDVFGPLDQYQIPSWRSHGDSVWDQAQPRVSHPWTVELEAEK